MSHWLFQTAVASSLFYQNYELSQIRDSAEEIEKVLKEAANDQIRLSFLKEKIYTIRKGLEIALERIALNPHQALYFALTVQRFFDRSNITTASFPEINDKIYFDQTLDAAKKLENGSTPLLKGDCVECGIERQGVLDFMLAQQCASLLKDYIAALDQQEFVAQTLIQFREEHPELAAQRTGEAGGVRTGRVFGLGCLLPSALVIGVGLWLDETAKGAVDGMACVGICIVLGALVAAFAAENRRVEDRMADGNRAFEAFLRRTQRAVRYESLSNKSAQPSMEQLRDQLHEQGFDPNQDVSELRRNLAHMGQIIAKYSAHIPDSAI